MVSIQRIVASSVVLLALSFVIPYYSGTSFLSFLEEGLSSLQRLQRVVFSTMGAICSVDDDTPATDLSYPASRPPAGMPCKLTVVTVNLLFERHYQKFRNKSFPEVPFAQRMATLTAYCSTVAASVDVFLFQECDVSQLKPLFKDGPLRNFASITSAEKGTESSVIVYNRQTMRPVGRPTVLKFTQSNGKPTSKVALLQLFTLKASGPAAVKVGLVSAHGPYESSAGTVQAMLLQLSRFVKNPDKWNFVVGGDFNVEQATYGKELAIAFQPCLWQDALAAVPSTSLGPTNTPSKIDYLFYSTGALAPVKLLPTSIDVAPVDQTSLVPHAAPPLPNSFFSDHVAAMVTFDVNNYLTGAV